MKTRTALVLTLLLLVTACAPILQTGSPDYNQLPTLVPSPLPSDYDLNGAEDVARRFLNAWAAQDYATMHSLVTFAARDKTPLADFTAFYADVTDDMTLQGVSYTIQTLQREQPSVALLLYDVDFDTRIVGTFTDAAREMRLTLDANDRDWRVAWTPGDVFNALADGGALRLERTVPRRANIYDRNGTVLADQNGRMVTVRLVVGSIPNYEACVGVLGTVLDLTRAEVIERFDRNSPDWLAEIGTMEAVAYESNQTALERDCDASFDAFFTRRYPQGALMPHVVGHVGYPTESEIPAYRALGFDQDSIVGRTGVEASWDETLRGTPGGRLSVVNGSDVVRIVAEKPAQPAHSVWLTIDAGLQAHTQQVIEDTYRANAEGFAPTSKGAAAVVIDVNTGAVLAMVSYPTYDANALVPFPVIGRDAANALIESLERNPRTPQLNRVTQGNYTSGSVMKIASTLAVVDSGIYDREQPYSCIGTWNRERGFVRADWLPQGHGFVTVRTALAQSCNPFYYEVGYQMDTVDPYLLPGYFSRFGLGEPSGMTDLAETPGLIAGPDYVRENYGLEWTFSRAVNMSIGQDIDITPLQIARMTSIVANGGTLYQPQLVLRTGLIGEGSSHELAPVVMDELDLVPEAIEVVREGMCDVTQENYGTADFQFDEPLSRIQQFVCGKTGTAQAPGEGAQPHAWFTAYAPMDNPEVAVAVIIENSGEGSAVAAPVARDILDYYLMEMDDGPQVAAAP